MVTEGATRSYHFYRKSIAIIRKDAFRISLYRFIINLLI